MSNNEPAATLEFGEQGLRIMCEALRLFKIKTARMKSDEIDGRGFGLQSFEFEKLDDKVATMQATLGSRLAVIDREKAGEIEQG